MPCPIPDTGDLIVARVPVRGRRARKFRCDETGCWQMYERTAPPAGAAPSTNRRDTRRRAREDFHEDESYLHGNYKPDNACSIHSGRPEFPNAATLYGTIQEPHTSTISLTASTFPELRVQSPNRFCAAADGCYSLGVIVSEPIDQFLEFLHIAIHVVAAPNSMELKN